MRANFRQSPKRALLIKDKDEAAKTAEDQCTALRAHAITERFAEATNRREPLDLPSLLLTGSFDRRTRKK
jgi:hypothetical protein